MKIWIDSGHSKLSAGATGNGIEETKYVLDVGLKLGKLLESKGITVYYSRTDENAMTGAKNGSQDLTMRCKAANENKVNYFISLHNNSAANIQANGIETLVYNDKAIEAIKLANVIQSGLIKDTSMNDRGIKYRSDLCVLRETNMTALLIEMGFLSNVGDTTKLKLDGYKDLLAKSIANSILSFLGMELIKEDDKEQQDDDVIYRVVCGSYGDRTNADSMVKELESKGYKPFIAIYKRE